jgi:glutathione S-transferase
VPSLILKDKTISKKPVTLSESMAICEFLEEAYPSKRKLLPKDPFKRLQVRRLCEIINSGTQPSQNLAVL